MYTELEYRVVDMMELKGGSFVKALGAAMRRADGRNFKKLKDTFPEYWHEYEQFYLDDCKARGVEPVEYHAHDIFYNINFAKNARA